MSKLFSAFNAVSKKEWENKINIDLNGADYNEKLVTNYEGIDIHPIYHSDDNLQSYNCNFPSTWETYQLIDATDAKSANKRALTALKNDVSGLCFSNPNNLDTLLEDISIEHIRIDFTNYSTDFPEKWKNYINGKTIHGAFHGITENAIPNFNNTILAKGKTAKEQIQSAYSQGIENTINIQFHFEIGGNYFLEIAKLKILIFSIKWSAEKNIKGCSFGISLIKAVLKIAGAVFLFEGSKTILYFLILFFLRCCLTCFRYFLLVLIIGAS